MKKFFPLVIIAFLLTPVLVEAQQASTIMLKDGSVIKGVVTGMANGEYTVQTPGLGTLRISQASILNIAAEQPQSASSVPKQMPTVPAIPGMDPGMAQQMQFLQGKMLADENVMMTIQKLMEDPAMSALLSDPQLFMQIMQNPQAAQQNPSVQKLLSNPQFQQLLLQVQQMLAIPSP